MPSRCDPRLVLALLLICAPTAARAFDESRYPDWSGAWIRIGSANTFADEQAGPPPLTPQYQAKFEREKAARLTGKADDNPTVRCLPPGMPRAMVAVDPIEIVITPNTTYLIIAYFKIVRRIYTDGRDWPAQPEPQANGYSIGHWEAGQASGRYDTLVIETRHISGPRTFDSTGVPMAADEATVVKERLHLDKDNPDLLKDEITTTDHALTRSWTVTRSYRRERNPTWTEFNCAEDNRWVEIAGENYLLGADDRLMPTAKGQKPPDLRHFQEP
jgi:hypothetical protein